MQVRLGGLMFVTQRAAGLQALEMLEKLNRNDRVTAAAIRGTEIVASCCRCVLGCLAHRRKPVNLVRLQLSLRLVWMMAKRSGWQGMLLSLVLHNSIKIIGSLSFSHTDFH